MSNVTFITPARATFAPALALAFCSMSAFANTPLVREPASLGSGTYETKTVQSSASGAFKMTTPSSIDSFEAEISRFYAQLAASQVELGHDYEALLLANISDLYEE